MMIFVISLQARAFYAYWILTYVCTLLTWRLLMDFESLFCWRNYWVHKFLGLSVNKAAQKINMSNNIMGKNLKVEAKKNVFQYLSFHSNFYWLPKDLEFWEHHILWGFFSPQHTAVPVEWFTIHGCLSGEARHILLSWLQWNLEGGIDPCYDT